MGDVIHLTQTPFKQASCAVRMGGFIILIRKPRRLLGGVVSYLRMSADMFTCIHAYLAAFMRRRAATAKAAPMNAAAIADTA